MPSLTKAQLYNHFLETLGIVIVEEVKFNTAMKWKFVKSMRKGSGFYRSVNQRHGDVQPHFKETPYEDLPKEKPRITKEGIERMLTHHGVK